MDLEGWYSVTPELVAVQIAERCQSFASPCFVGESLTDAYETIRHDR